MSNKISWFKVLAGKQAKAEYRAQRAFSSDKAQRGREETKYWALVNSDNANQDMMPIVIDEILRRLASVNMLTAPYQHLAEIESLARAIQAKFNTLDSRLKSVQRTNPTKGARNQRNREKRILEHKIPRNREETLTAYRKLTEKINALTNSTGFDLYDKETWTTWNKRSDTP